MKKKEVPKAKQHHGSDLIDGRGHRRKLERDIISDKNSKLTSSIHIISLIKNRFSAIQAKRAIDSLPKQNLDELYKTLFPIEYGDFGKNGFAFSSDIFGEIRWAQYVFLTFPDIINKYLQLKKSVEKNILLGNYKSAIEDLDKLDSETGLSLWSTEKRLSVASLYNGGPNINTVLFQVLNNSDNGLFKILTYYTKLKVEKSVSYHAYEEEINNLIKKTKDKGTKNYWKFKLLFFRKPSHDQLNSIASFDNSFSIIDYYETLVTCLIQYTINHPLTESEIKTITTFVNDIYQNVDDPRLNNLYRFLTNNFLDIKLKEVDAKIVISYLDGNYSSAIKLLKKAIKESPICFEYYYLLSRCILAAGDEIVDVFPHGSIAAEILNDIYQVQRNTDDTPSISVKFQKRAYSLGVNELTVPYYYFIFNELPRVLSKWQEFKFLFQSSYLLDILYVFECDLTFTFASNSTFTEKLVDLKSIAKNSSNDEILNYISNKPELGLIIAKLLFRSRNYTKALDLVNSLLIKKEFQSSIYSDLILYKKEILLLQKKYLEAAELIVDAVLQNENIIFKLYDPDLIEVLMNTYDESIQQNISVPIVLQMMLSTSNSSDLWVPFDNFLSCHGLSHPSEVSELEKTVGNAKLIYFMEHLCVKDVYDSSYQYDGQDDLDLERIRVLKVLERISPQKRAIYKDESSDIERDIQIRQALKHIDESKIFVNTKFIRSKLNDKLLENIERYKELEAMPVGLNKLIEKTRAIIIIGMEAEEVAKISYEIEEALSKYENPRYLIFKSNFLAIRDEFISSSEYGIDSYLSMRVRHGALLGQVRSIFEKHHLVTKKKDTKSGAYQSNLFWLSKLVCLKDEHAKIDKHFAEFSSKIDSTTDELRRKYLQIKIEGNKSEALFDFSFTDEELFILYQDVFYETSEVNSFFDKVLEVLWARTEEVLTKVQAFINQSVASDLLKYTENLKANIDRCIPGMVEHNSIKEFHNTILICSTDITYELLKISEWFKRSTDKKIENFGINLPIEICLKIVKYRSSDYQLFIPQVENNTTVKIDGEYLPQFTDLIKNLIDNILVHSDLTPAELIVKIEISINGNYMDIIFKNNFSNNVDLSVLNSGIKDTRKSLTIIGAESRSGKEGKTGYLKIKNILRNDFNCGNSYSIEIKDVDENRIFETHLRFKIADLLYTK